MVAKDLYVTFSSKVVADMFDPHGGLVLPSVHSRAAHSPRIATWRSVQPCSVQHRFLLDGTTTLGALALSKVQTAYLLELRSDHNSRITHFNVKKPFR